MNPLHGELVRLAQVERGNLESYKRWFRDYEVQRFLALPALPVTDEFEEQWYERVSANPDRYLLAIRTLADDRLIGNCGLFNIDHRNHSAEFGIVIGEKDCWGKGFGTDACRIMLRLAFDEFNLNRVQLHVYAFNPRARRAYEKAGFVYEGTYRQLVYREGQYHDAHVMAALREEWKASNR